MVDLYNPQPWLSPTNNPDGAQRPMSVQVNVSLPPDANSQDANLLMQSAASIINAQTAQLDRFVANQRQQQSINPLPYKAVSARMERMRARWLSNNGLERLELEVFPSSGQLLSVSPVGIVFDIDVPFTGWPVLAHAFTQPGWFDNSTRAFGHYLFDNGFTPNVPTATDPTIPALSVGSDMWDAVSSSVYAFLNYITTDAQTFDAYNPSYWSGPSSGLPQEWWVNGVAGSGICSTAVVGRQYWEVDIITLQTATPPDKLVHVAAWEDIPAAQGFSSSTYDALGADIRWKWPQGLNTFYTPAIGLVPATFLDPHQKGNYWVYGSVVGLDPEPQPKARSLGLQRTKVADNLGTFVGYDPGDYTGYPTHDFEGRKKIRYCDELTDPNADLTQPRQWGSKVDKNGMVTFGEIFFGVDGMVFQLVYPGYGPAPTRAQGQKWLNQFRVGDLAKPPENGSRGGFLINDCEWVVVGTVEAGIIGFNLTVESVDNGPPIYTSVEQVSLGTITRTMHKITTTTSPAITGDVLYAADAFDVHGDPVAEGTNAMGEHFSPFLGRLDLLNSIKTPAQTVAVTNTNPVTGGLNNGCWSGVDLGPLKEKDTVMVATDTTTREVWFGKNGKWYDKAGPTNKFPGQNDYPGALLMDGDENTAYYPACSIRVGRTHLRMRFGAAQRRQPPPGFATYPLALQILAKQSR